MKQTNLKTLTGVGSKQNAAVAAGGTGHPADGNYIAPNVDCTVYCAPESVAGSTTDSMTAATTDTTPNSYDDSHAPGLSTQDGASDREVLQKQVLHLEKELSETNRKNLELQHHKEDLQNKLANVTKAYMEVKEEVDVALQAKSAFLARMSHELRTPLNAIMGFAQLQQLENSLPPFLLEYSNHIFKAGSHLLEMVDNVLDFSNRASESVNYTGVSCSTDRVIRQCIERHKNLAEDNNVSVYYQPQECLVLADPDDLNKIMNLLLSNAILYNRSGGKVHFSCKSAGTQIEINVSDTGVGIEPAWSELVFQPLVRMPYAEENQIPGIGIGLSLIAKLVDKMNGTIRLDSDEGSGSQFTLVLPSVIG